MALLLNRLYAPLTALATARLDVVTALVSFERVFEVLDIEPLIKEAEVTTPLPPGPLAVELSHVRFAYPSAEAISLASLEEVAVLDDRAGEEVLHGVTLRVERGPDHGPRRPLRRGEVDHRIARAAPVRPGRRVAWRWAAWTCGTSPSTTSARAVGVVTQDGHLFHDTIRANLAYAAPEAGEDEIWDALVERPPRRPGAVAARRVRHGGGRARLPALGG